MLDVVAGASTQDLFVGGCYLVIVGAVLGELWWLRLGGPDPVRAREARTAVGSALGAVAVGVAYTAVLAAVWPVVARLGPGVLPGIWRDHPVLGFVTAFVAWDAAGYAYHLLGHRTRLGWAAHRPHHTATHLNLAAGLRQSWVPWHGLLVHPLVALGGWDLGTIAVGAALSSAWQLLEHSATPVRFPRWVGAVVMTPQAHRHHHLVDAGPVNLGPVFTVWDRACRTWVPGAPPAGASFGVPGPVPAGALALQAHGWRQLWPGRRQPAAASLAPQ